MQADPDEQFEGGIGQQGRRLPYLATGGEPSGCVLEFEARFAHGFS
jgi:hypothetical protein